MVKKAIKFLGGEIRGLHEAAYLLALFAFISQILGLIRDRILASKFGAGEVLDIYYAGFKIPDIIFTIIISLVAASVLVPFLVKIIDSKENTLEFMNSIFTILVVIAITLCVAVFVFTPKLLEIFVPSLLFGNYGDDLIAITRILLIQPLLLSVSVLFGSVNQAYKKFFIYALSPVLYNIGIIVGILYFWPILGLRGLAWGVILGSILHLLVQIPSVSKQGIIPRFTSKINFALIRKVLTLSVPRTFALISTQLIVIVMVALAAQMISGSVAIFTFSFNLQAVPLAIIGVSYSIAAFPTLSRLFSSGEIKDFVGHISKAARHIIFWSLPIITLLVVLRAQIVRTVLGSGEFSWNDTRLTAAALAIFSISILAQSINLLLIRGYYSAGQTKRPLIFAVISSLVTVVLSFLLVNFWNGADQFRNFVETLFRVRNIPGTSILMLPMAYSIGVILNSLMLWISFEIKFKGFSKKLWRTFFESLGASLVMGCVAFWSLKVFVNMFNTETLVGIFLQGFTSGIVGICAGAIMLTVFKNREIITVWKTLHKKIWKTKLVAIDE